MMKVMKQLLVIGFRRKFNQDKFRTKMELDEYISTAKGLADELGLQVEPQVWKHNTGTIYHLNWLVDGKTELDELLSM